MQIIFRDALRGGAWGAAAPPDFGRSEGGRRPALIPAPPGFLTLVPCPFTSRKLFCAGPNFLSQPKNLTAISASSKTFVPAQKPILLNANHLFVWHKMFVTGTICK